MRDRSTCMASANVMRVYRSSYRNQIWPSRGKIFDIGNMLVQVDICMYHVGDVIVHVGLAIVVQIQGHEACSPISRAGAIHKF